MFFGLTSEGMANEKGENKQNIYLFQHMLGGEAHETNGVFDIPF